VDLSPLFANYFEFKLK